MRWSNIGDKSCQIIVTFAHPIIHMVNNFIITTHIYHHKYAITRSSCAFLGADDNSHGQFHTTPFVISIKLNLCNIGYFCNMFQSTQSSLLDNLINWMYVYIIIRPNFVYLLADPNSLHEQFYTSLLWFQLN